MTDKTLSDRVAEVLVPNAEINARGAAASQEERSDD